MKQRIFLIILLSGSLVKGLAQVSLQTGAATYNVPLYSYSDPNNRLATGVSIVYTAGNGLKVNEIPSSIGAGWALDCGGFIQRIQHGEPDDQKNNNTYVYPTSLNSQQQELDFQAWTDGYYPNGYLYSEFSTSQTIDDVGGYIPMAQGSNFRYKPHPRYQADMEQDVFAFNFNGRTGYFVIGKKDQNNVYPIRTLYDSKLKIEKIDGDLNNSNHIRTTISEFRITDENGIKYVFKDADLDQVCTYNKEEWYRNSDGGHEPDYQPIIYTNPFSMPYYRVSVADTTNDFIKSKWYLSEIINPLTNVKITFEYENYRVDIRGNKTAVYNTSNSGGSLGLSIERIKSISKRLKRIVLSANETVQFNYSVNERVDLPGDRLLESIDIKYGGQTKSSWVFQQGYFVKTDIKSLSYSFTNAEKPWARLCLQGISKKGSSGTLLPQASFTYYLGNESGNSTVPPLFSFYQDEWGYYNVSKYGFFNPANHTFSGSNSPYEPVQGDLLPSSEYEKALVSPASSGVFYRAPTFDVQGGTLKSITNVLGGTTTFEYEANDYIYVSTTPNDYFKGTGGVRVKKVKLYDGLDHGKDIVQEYKYILANGSTSGWGDDKQVYFKTTDITVLKQCGNQTHPVVVAISKAISAQISSVVIKQLKNAGNASESGGLSFSAGIAVYALQYIINKVVEGIIATFTDPSDDFTSYESRSVSYTSDNRLPYQYSRVEVVNDAAVGTVGKTVYEFTSPSETDPTFAIDAPNQTFPFSSKQRYAYWLYGLEKKVSYLDKDGHLIKKIENVYDPVKNVLNADTSFKSQKWDVTKKLYGCAFLPTISSTLTIAPETYYPITGRISLNNTKLYTYNANNDSSLTTTQYQYSSNYLLNKISSTNSKGELVETRTYYPTDYSLTGALQTMRDSNIISAPVATQTLITKNGSTKYMIGGTVTSYAAAPNGDIKPGEIFSARMTDPVLSTSVAFSASQLNPNSSYYQSISTATYDANGAPITVVSDAGITSTIYDYKNQIPIASVVNASQSNIAYTSFEADGTGGWTYDPLKVGEEFSPTGKRCLKSTFGDGGTTLVSKSINNTKKYILSFWKKGDEPQKSGGTFTLKKSYANTATGYTYYEYEVTGSSAVTITNVTGSGRFLTYNPYELDEVRLYPVEARMNTATYDPLIGKTSECDENGRITYYEYDDLGRLKLVRDQNRNVIKTYEYNYKQ